MQAISRHFDSQDWITLVFLGILLILVFVKTRYPEQFFNFRRIHLSNKYFTENKKSPKVLGFFGFLLFFAHTLILSLGIYFLILGLGYSSETTFFLFAKVFAVYSVFIAGKYFLEKILATLFSIERFLDRYIFFKITLKNFLALCLLPVLVLLSYLWNAPPIFLKLMALLFVLLNAVNLMLYYRKRRQQLSSNLFHFILYLCAFEIAPYYILFKVMT